MKVLQLDKELKFNNLLDDLSKVVKEKLNEDITKDSRIYLVSGSSEISGIINANFHDKNDKDSLVIYFNNSKETINLNESLPNSQEVLFPDSKLNILFEREIIFNEITLNASMREAFVKNEPLHLTELEFKILILFVSNHRKIISNKNLLKYLWGEEKENVNMKNALYSHIKNIRKKLVQANCSFVIESIYGLGYKFY